MEPIITAIIAELTKQHDNLKKTFAGAPQAALDWRPGPETNSLAVLAIHVAGAEKYWIGDLTTGRPSTRDRDAEFQVQGLTHDALAEALDAALADSIAVLTPLRAEELNAIRHVARYNRDQSIATSLLHAATHAALHVGHAELTRQMYDQQHA
jgi:uncharacterized damage-inducible protein DinB